MNNLINIYYFTKSIYYNIIINISYYLLNINSKTNLINNKETNIKNEYKNDNSYNINFQKRKNNIIDENSDWGWFIIIDDNK